MTGTKTRFNVFIIISIVAIALCACNDDVFVDHDVRPSVDNITLNGDRGIGSFSFSTDGIKSINLSGNGFTKDFEGSEIEVCGQWNKFRANISGSRVNLESVANASGREIEYILNFDYGYVVYSVAVKILPGSSPVVKSVNYFADKASVTAQPKVMRTRTAYNNPENKPLIINLYPLKNSESTARIELDDNIHNNIILPAEMQLPVFDGEKWLISNNKTDVIINGYVRFFADIEEEPYVLELAPGQSVIVELTVDFKTVRAPFQIELFVSLLGFTNYFTGIAYVTQAVDYNINIEWDSTNQ